MYVERSIKVNGKIKRDTYMVTSSTNRGGMFFNLSVLNLKDHLGLVISPRSPFSGG